MQKLSSDEYSYTVTAVNGNSYIVVMQSSTGKTKRFFQAGNDNTAALYQHLNSLTDSLFSQWFTASDHKKKEKQNAGKSKT